MIKLDGVSKLFGKIQAINEVKIEFNEGVYGLLGPNGSGKTTLMRCLVGVLRPTSGQIERPKYLGYLPQKFGMFKQLRVSEVMEFFADLKGVPSAKRRMQIQQSLASVRLEQVAKQKVGSLSGGMTRRLGIAQALLGEPDLIVFDEPTAGLDPEERLHFKNLVASKELAPTVIISTHIVEDIESVCDRVIILDKGQVLTNSTPEEICQRAEGMIFNVSVAERAKLQEPFLLIRENQVEGQANLRVLSARKQPGQVIKPTVEDGYMAFLHPEV